MHDTHHWLSGYQSQRSQPLRPLGNRAPHPVLDTPALRDVDSPGSLGMGPRGMALLHDDEEEESFEES